VKKESLEIIGEKVGEMGADDVDRKILKKAP